jgi:hypothetical protein
MHANPIFICEARRADAPERRNHLRRPDWQAGRATGAPNAVSDCGFRSGSAPWGLRGLREFVGGKILSGARRSGIRIRADVFAETDNFAV